VAVQVKTPDTFAILPSPFNLCKGDSVLLTVKVGKDAIADTYSWLSDIGLQDPHSPQILVSPISSQSYQVMATDDICSTWSVLTAQVNVLERPSVTLSKSNDINCIYGQAQLTATGGVRYTWSPAATLTNPGIADPFARTDTNTLYRVQVTGANGCSTLDSIMLLATKEPGSIGFPVANAFTPNGDGNNDCFGIKYWGYIGDFEMSVFDRWGVRVYYSKDPYQCWDGRYKGQLQAAGAYVYTIKASALCGTAIRKGTVTLVR
jgi:gliding motility-associated-like protein